MRIGIITLLPDMFDALHYGIVGRAIKNKSVSVDLFNPRDFTQDKHRTVDDKSYGGGPGMVMMVQPIRDAILAAKQKLGTDTKVIYLSPQGKTLVQASISTKAKHEKLILLCGRYEGIDERLIELEVDEQVSIGDYVLSGGEFAAMVLIDAMTRLIPGALGHEDSAEQDSFAKGLLDFPHYTRPMSYEGQCVPDVLSSGDHKRIAQWRLKQALGNTWINRPDLLEQYDLESEEKQLLDEYIKELGETHE